MFDMPNDKSPGLDGFPTDFIKMYWPTVGWQIPNVVCHFLATGNLLKEGNRSLIVLIPKVEPPEEVNHLPPISLCNVVYKCVSQCMMNRMQSLLLGQIDNYQNAFVPR